MDGVPESVDEIIKEAGIYVPDDISDEERVLYERMLLGECILCERACGEHTAIIVNDIGVVMLFCSQVCLQDFFNMHWMMEQYDDFVEKAKFRNQEGNN